MWRRRMEFGSASLAVRADEELREASIWALLTPSRDVAAPTTGPPPPPKPPPPPPPRFRHAGESEAGEAEGVTPLERE